MIPASEKDRLLMIPGPVPVKWEILEALGEPTISHTGSEIATVITPILDHLRAVMGNPGGLSFVFAGSGTLAQEAAVATFVEPGQRLLVVSNGFFGDRFIPIARAHGIDVDVLSAPWGTSVTADQLAAMLDDSRFDALTITHVETSTGVMAPLPDLVQAARSRGVFCIVDGVCATGGVPEPMQVLGIDVLLTGAQKALGVPPGLSILGVSPDAWKRREQRAAPVGSYYADLANWLPSMQDPRRYFSTHAVNMMYALRAGLEIVVAEGLEERFARHRRLAAKFRQGMAELGFEPATDPEYLAPTLSVLRTPDGVEPAQLRQDLSAAGIVAAAGLGEFAADTVRFGHMGNISEAEVVQTLAAAEQVMTRQPAVV